MIAAEHLIKSYQEQRVITSFTHEFLPGQLNTLIGASGSGKTTLLRILLGLEPASSGTIYYSGKVFSPEDADQMEAIRQKTGVLFQGGALFDAKTVYENVRLPLELYSDLSANEKHHRVMECIARVMLSGKEKRFPSELSGGMKKRAALARAIVNKPLYLFCDEPNSGLDPMTSYGIDELISGITHELQTTTILVTHDMNTVFSVSDAIVFLHEGEIAWKGSRKDLNAALPLALQKFMNGFKTR